MRTRMAGRQGERLKAVERQQAAKKRRRRIKTQVLREQVSVLEIALSKTRSTSTLDFEGLNDTEQRVLDVLTADGAEVYRGGWPDFAVRIGNAVFTLEVKSDASPRLQLNQKKMHSLLRSLGVKVVVVNGSYQHLLSHIKAACSVEGIEI